MRLTLLFVIISISFCSLSFHQPASTAFLLQSEKDLTIPYSITITSKKSGVGIAETYNGGIETLFAGAHVARLRLVSLMRIQSVFITTDKALLKSVTIIKESGNIKHRSDLSPTQWMQYNKKYAGSTCRFTQDTAMVLNHVCKKAIISLRDGRQLTAYYTPAIQRTVFAFLEPAFTQIPGLVLKYTYTYKKKTITYTATAISNNPISADILAIPAN
jgi:hypothetical protein